MQFPLVLFSLLFVAHVGQHVRGASVRLVSNNLELNGTAELIFHEAKERVWAGLSNDHRYPIINSGDQIALKMSYTSGSNKKYYMRCTTSYCYRDSCPGPIRYIAKLYQIIHEERQREVVVQPSKARTDFKKKIVTRESSVMELRFNDLPVNLQLYIFSYLNAKTLSGIARTCKYWKMLSEDKILWENLLWTDLQKWKFINHRSYPYTYLETNSELTPKQIYLRCCPECQKIQQTTRNSFTSLLLHTLPASMFQRHPPKVVMFGPGLESDTHKLVQKLLWDKTISPATVDGMFPGEFEGIGSGVCLKIGGSKMNLITLYATNRAEREQNAREGRNRVSKLLAAAPPQPEADGQEDNDDGNDLRTVEVSHGVRLLCQNVDAFIYVVDSSAESQRVNIGDKELQAMMNNSKSQPRQPLLVLSAVATQDTLPLSCVRVTDMLQMNKLNRPWQVNMMCVENLDGLLEGMTWLLKQVV